MYKTYEEAYEKINFELKEDYIDAIKNLDWSKEQITCAYTIIRMIASMKNIKTGYSKESRWAQRCLDLIAKIG